MRGEKQIQATAFAMAMLAGNLYTTSAPLNIEPVARVAIEAALPTAPTVMPESLPTIDTAPTTTSLVQPPKHKVPPLKSSAASVASEMDPETAIDGPYIQNLIVPALEGINHPPVTPINTETDPVNAPNQFILEADDGCGVQFSILDSRDQPGYKTAIGGVFGDLPALSDGHLYGKEAYGNGDGSLQHTPNGFMDNSVDFPSDQPEAAAPLLVQKAGQICVQLEAFRAGQLSSG